MAIDPLSYTPKGDKKNSDFFNEYRIKIYERRKSSGIEDLLTKMKAIVIQVEHGEAIAYLRELYLMGPYRYTASYTSATHRLFVLTSQLEFPRLIVIEPLFADYCDELTMFNRLYPLAAPKPNARYIGEVFHTNDVAETRRTLESHNIRFNYHHETKNPLLTESQ
ncbi:MAG: hypothetical protein MI757_14465, partial [Pirellulales bacterium]|nr:hypothetical protein [Pirellulales bacterium]